MNKVNHRPLQRNAMPAALQGNDEENAGLSAMPPAWGGMHPAMNNIPSISAAPARNRNAGSQFDVNNVKAGIKNLSFLRGGLNMGSELLGKTDSWAAKTGGVLSPFSLLSGALGWSEAVNNTEGNSMSQRVGDGIFSAASTFSGGVGTYNLGATLAGTAKAATLAPAAKVAGAGALGYGVGKMGDKLTGWGMRKTRLDRVSDRVRGIRRGEGERGDYSMSGMMGDWWHFLDRQNVKRKRRRGTINQDAPEYTQTLGWRLAERFNL